MNVSAWDGDPQDDILAEVDFKWLMAGQGHWVDTTMLRTDTGYAHQCVETALQCPCTALQAIAPVFDHPANAPTSTPPQRGN